MIIHIDMKIPSIEKICSRCDESFFIPNIKSSKARELLLIYTPCPHCLYQKKINTIDDDKSGRCRDCSIPFSLVDHHAKGRCGRRARSFYRERDKKK